ncbi:MAG: outer membrane protein assembly factor BamB, partial [Pseudomonadales bacterium]|nr:outer membrane protein assembly factor BamB [Pseudomonadales bacterium]
KIGKSNYMIRFIVSVLLVVCVAGCSWFSDKDKVKPAELVDFKQEIKVKKLWSHRLGDQGPFDLQLALTPAVAENRLYTTNHKGKLAAYELSTGKKLWHADIDQAVISAVGAGEGLVAVGTEHGYLVVVDVNTSSIRWQAPLSSEMLSAPQIAGTRIIVQTIDGRVISFDAETGEQQWDFSAIMPSLTLRGSSTPAIEGGLVYLAFASGKVVALDLENGIRVWQQQVAIPQGKTELDRIVDIDMKPMIVGDDIYVASYQGQAASLNRLNGQGLWKVDGSSLGDMSYTAGQVYLSQSDGFVSALSMVNGREVWRNDHFVERQITAPATVGNYLAVADFEGYVHFMDKSDGHFVARYKVGGKGVRNRLIGLNNQLFVLNNKGRLFSLQVP